MDLRRQYPFMGKARLPGVLDREGRRLSVSMVGRILERALAADAIRRASFCEGRIKPKRRCRFAKWAKRWKYGRQASADIDANPNIGIDAFLLGSMAVGLPANILPAALRADER